MDSMSDPAGGVLPEQAAHLAERNVGIDGERGKLDGQREAIRQEVARLLSGAVLGVQAITVGLRQYDDHQVIEGLRRMLSVGALARPLADQLQATLPQPTRLFDPGR